MPPVLPLILVSLVPVDPVTREMVTSVPTLTSARRRSALPTLSARTPREASTVFATMDSLETAYAVPISTNVPTPKPHSESPGSLALLRPLVPTNALAMPASVTPVTPEMDTPVPMWTSAPLMISAATRLVLSA